jgi:hypothetical protein
MELRGLRWQSMDLTHRCNLHCDWCGKRTHESDYEMTMAQVDNMLHYINLNVPIIRVSGGEPLIHPQFIAIMQKLLTQFQRVNVATNGTLLDRMPKSITHNSRINYLVSSYGPRPTGYSYFNVTPTQFFDPRHDPNIPDDQLLDTYLSCPYIQIKVIGDKVYDCCHAETVERIYGGDYGATVGPNWKQELESVERWGACKHCFIARPQPYEPTR